MGAVSLLFWQMAVLFQIREGTCNSMGDVASSNKLSGPQAVEVFLEELHQLLGKTPGGRLRGSKRTIVERVVCESARLTNCNVELLTKQFSMAINGAKSKGRFRFSNGSASICEVSLA